MHQVFYDSCIQFIEHVLTLFATADQTGLPEQIQVMGDTRACHIEMTRYIPGGQTPLFQQFQDLPPCRVTKGFKYEVQ